MGTTCTCYFGFLWSGKATVPSQSAYNPDIHLSIADVSLDSQTNPQVVAIRIKASKTNPFHKGVTIIILRTDLYRGMPGSHHSQLHRGLGHHPRSPLQVQRRFTSHQRHLSPPDSHHPVPERHWSLNIPVTASTSGLPLQQQQLAYQMIWSRPSAAGKAQRTWTASKFLSFTSISLIQADLIRDRRQKTVE